MKHSDLCKQGLNEQRDKQLPKDLVTPRLHLSVISSNSSAHLGPPLPLGFSHLCLLKNVPPLLHLPGTLQPQLVQIEPQRHLFHAIFHAQLSRSRGALEKADQV